MGIVMATATISGGFIAELLSQHQTNHSQIALSGLGVIFLASFAGRLASLFMLSRITIPESAPTAVAVPSSANASWA